MHIRAFALVVLTVAAALVGLTVAPLRWVAFAVVAAGAGWLGWMVRRQTTEAAQQRADADKLRRKAVDLEGQVQAGVADAKASEERLRSIIDSAVDGIIVIDRRGHIESVNPAAERLFGYARAEVVGRNVSMLMRRRTTTSTTAI
jgi:PAS domain-containing protein